LDVHFDLDSRTRPTGTSEPVLDVERLDNRRLSLTRDFLEPDCVRCPALELELHCFAFHFVLLC
jgi:hypothetical protein